MAEPSLENGPTWDYVSHPGGCCARVENGAHTVCCSECAGTGMFPVPWVENVEQARTSGDAGCVACKETGRAIVALAAQVCCGGTGRIPRAEWWVRGGHGEPDYDRDPIVKTAVCPTCYVPEHLTTIEMGKPGARYTLMDGGPRYEVHLAGEAANGGTGPNICGLDRHARDPETGRHLHGFSVGGGVCGGPGYPASHEACPGCAALADGRPIGGTHKGLFELVSAAAGVAIREDA